MNTRDLKDSDPFEEFEFRPLNEGLGFHKGADKAPEKKPVAPIEPALKAKILESQAGSNGLGASSRANGNLSEGPSQTSTRVSQAPISAAIPKPKDSKIPFLKNALPRPGQLKTPASMPFEQLPNADKILEKIAKQNLDFEEQARHNQSPIEQNRKQPTSLREKAAQAQTSTETTTNYSLSALILDGMLLTAAFLTCLIILLMVTKVDLVASLADPEATQMLYISLGGMFMALAWLYLVVHRMGLGATTGEWVFDQRLGRTDQLNTASYLMKTSLRSLIVVATGLIPIPLLSLILGKDLLGRWLGVELHSTEVPVLNRAGKK